MSNPEVRNLPVPYFSQRENIYIWKEKEPKYKGIDALGNSIPNPNAGNLVPNGARTTMSLCSCNVTCLAMLLHYAGITKDTPDMIMKIIFEKPGENEYVTDELRELKESTYGPGGDNKVLDPNFLKDAVEVLYGITNTIVSPTVRNLEYIKKQVGLGFPVMVSCGITRKHEESYYRCIIDGICSDNLNSYDHNGIQNIKDDLNLRYKKISGSGNSYEADLSAASSDSKEKTEREQKIITINFNYEMAKQEVLDYCLDNYRTHGHFIIIRGFTTDSVIINDPWGDPTDFHGIFPSDGKGNYYNSSPYGDNIRISLSDFQKQYSAGTGNFWSTLVVYHNRWNFVYEGLIPRGTVPTRQMLDECLNHETFEYGGYPMKRSNLWHNGIHLRADNPKTLFPIGPGQIIAARITDADTSDSDNTPPANGNRCFVLVKHNINVKDEIREFYSLYMHLEPEENPHFIIDNYPLKRFKAEWLNELMFRSLKVAKVYDSKEPAIYRSSDNRNIGIFTRGKIFVYARIETVADQTRIYFDHDDNGSTVECYSFYDGNFMTYPSAYKSNASLLMEKYKTVLDSLAQGKTTYFTELPDPVIEVSASTSLGNTGVFGGYDGKNQGMIHLEVFSDDVVIPDYRGKNYELIELDESPSALCNREEMIQLFDKFGLYGALEGWSWMHLQDGIISKAEMTSYYNLKPAKLRNMICQHRSEWSDSITWEEELNNSIGVPKGHPVIRDHLGEELREDIKGYINNIYEPFKWFNSEDCLMAMNPSSDGFLSRGCATFYHPIEFIEWLTIHDGLLISLASHK